MSQVAVVSSSPIEKREEDEGRSIWADAYLRILKNKVAVICFFVIVFYILMALAAKLGIIATDYKLVDNAHSYQAPSFGHLFGTDFLGRDVLSRAIHGTATALAIGLFSALIAIPIGVTLGALAGYFGGFIDDIVTWFGTTMDSIPNILLIPAFSFVLGRGLTNVFIAIGMTSWVGLCWLVRAEFMKHRQREYVLAAQALGVSHVRRIFLHILPNIFHIILINFTLTMVMAIKFEVILSYLGMGVEAGTPSWGIMIDDAKQELTRGVWWGLGAATIFMFFLVLSLFLFNDALREALDPKLKNK